MEATLAERANPVVQVEKNQVHILAWNFYAERMCLVKRGEQFFLPAGPFVPSRVAFPIDAATKYVQQKNGYTVRGGADLQLRHPFISLLNVERAEDQVKHFERNRGLEWMPLSEVEFSLEKGRIQCAIVRDAFTLFVEYRETHNLA